MRRVCLPALLAPLLSGCLEHLPADLPASRLGATSDVPIGPASGRAHSVHFFDWRRFGDDTTAAAVRKALGKNPENDLINATVSRKVLCFPACRWPIITWSETAVEGTVARYKRLPEWTKPEPAERAKLFAGQSPSAEALLERLMHLHLHSPPEAAQFFASLENASREEVIRFVLASKGVLAVQSRTFTIPRGAPPEERRFLAWFVSTYTTYQPLDQ